MITAIIPARGGSKGIPNKNIMELGGFPLIAYSIAAAKMSKSIDRVVVSTDSVTIRDVASHFGAETPFLRPAKYATDKSKDIEFVLHFLKWAQKEDGAIPDYLVHLRPTTPLREASEIDRAIAQIKKVKSATSLRSAHALSEAPQKMFSVEKGFFKGLFDKTLKGEYWNLPRQAFPATYHPNGYVDIVIPGLILKASKLHGNKISAFITRETGEIDSPEDLSFVNFKLKEQAWNIHQHLKSTY